MAVTYTPRLGLPRWSAGTDPLARVQMDTAMANLEAKTVLFLEGTLAARPAPGVVARLYRVTDAAADATVLFYDTGSVWVDASPPLAAFAKIDYVNSGLAGKAATSHTHTAAQTTSGVFNTARLGSGVADTTKVLRGDGSWQTLGTTLAGLTDVVITSPAGRNALVYDSGTSKWIDAALQQSDVSGLVAALAAVNTRVDNVAQRHLTINNQAGTTYTLQLVDASERYVICNNAAAITVTVPTNGAVAFPIGSIINIAQANVGRVTVVGSGGVTIRALYNQNRLGGQYSSATLVKVAANEWYLSGQIGT